MAVVAVVVVALVDQVVAVLVGVQEHLELQTQVAVAAVVVFQTVLVLLVALVLLLSVTKVRNVALGVLILLLAGIHIIHLHLQGVIQHESFCKSRKRNSYTGHCC
jgi:hypothetical protein